MRSTAVVRHWLERFNAGDVAGMLELYAEDAEVQMAFAEPMRGRPAIQAMLEAYFGTGALHCTIRDLHDAGEWAILEWNESNGLMGANVYRVVDGMIVVHRSYFDQRTFLRNMGIPQPSE